MELGIEDERNIFITKKLLMTFTITIKREFFLEVFNQLYVENVEYKKEEIIKYCKSIFTMIVILVFNYFFVSSVVAFILICVFIIPIVFLLYKIFKLNNDTTKPFDYSEEYYKQLESYNSITLSLLDNSIQLDEDTEKTIWNIADITYAIIRENYVILIFSINHDNSLIIPKKCLSEKDFEYYKLFVESKIK
jgi:hypothetical protein